MLVKAVLTQPVIYEAKCVKRPIGYLMLICHTPVNGTQMIGRVWLMYIDGN